ncbi:MAG: hypothetical protein HYY49_03595 [Ignavibacteriales bacterium]|nr:hypothetical protein [Ignavibacteriales bacterium]
MLNRLTLESFISTGSDLEASQYRILNALKSHYEEFSRNRLYPALSDLIELALTLEGLLKEKSDLHHRLPQHLKKIDLTNKRLIYEPLNIAGPDIERMTELMSWALPQIRKAIEEGMRIFDFVDERISLSEVGILPMYQQEGYAFVPENKESLLHLLRYEVSLYTSGKERYRTIKTRFVKSVRQFAVRLSPESIKLEVIQEHKDLPNPATFVFETDLEFPYAETILPIAKRKLMMRVAA